ncbi:unnamed protein product [Brassica rapa subsp. trilocularis]
MRSFAFSDFPSLTGSMVGIASASFFSVSFKDLHIGLENISCGPLVSTHTTRGEPK